MDKVFVYGTLLTGENNNRLLSSSELLGEATADGFDMYSLGGFPACVENEESKIPVKGEVWKVDPDTMTRLDMLEGYPSFYDRKEIPTEFGTAWIYTMNRAANGRNALIKTGSWKER